jgi:predicted aspartyl protease
MTVPVTVNGQGPFHFVIDTGADRTVISKELAEQLVLPKSGTAKLHAMGGSAQVNMVRIDRIQISDKVSRKVRAAALPRKYVGADGLIGIDSLKGQRIVMDFRAATMVKPIQMIDVLGKSTPADYTVVSRLRIGGVMLGNAALAFADAYPFKLFELEKKPSMLLGMESLRAFQRVSVDFAARKIKFLIPSGMAPPSDRLAQDAPKTKVGAP